MSNNEYSLKINSTPIFGSVINAYFSMSKATGFVNGTTKFGNVVGHYPQTRFCLNPDNSIESKEFMEKISILPSLMLEKVIEANVIDPKDKPRIDTTCKQFESIKIITFRLPVKQLGSVRVLNFENGISGFDELTEVGDNTNNYTKKHITISNPADLHKYPGHYNVKYRIAGLSINNSGPELKYSLIIFSQCLTRMVKLEKSIQPTYNGKVLNIVENNTDTKTTSNSTPLLNELLPPSSTNKKDTFKNTELTGFTFV